MIPSSVSTARCGRRSRKTSPARQQQSHGDHRIERIHVQQQAEGDAQQRSVGEGIAKIGHPAPDDKRAQRAGGAGKHHPGQPAGKQ